MQSFLAWLRRPVFYRPPRAHPMGTWQKAPSPRKPSSAHSLASRLDPGSRVQQSHYVDNRVRWGLCLYQCSSVVRSTDARWKILLQCRRPTWGLRLGTCACQCRRLKICHGWLRWSYQSVSWSDPWLSADGIGASSFHLCGIIRQQRLVHRQVGTGVAWYACQDQSQGCSPLDWSSCQLVTSSRRLPK